jgi:protein-L-isoaspartate(D-aspartate) O-methyltransferase
MTDYGTLRETMVNNQLRTQDVTDIDILEAMGSVPREAFLSSALKPIAYSDKDLQIRRPAGGESPRYMMAPGSFAKLVQLADIQRADIVLVVGCGNGYSAAVIARLADSVVAVEQDSALAEIAAQALMSLEIDNAAVVSGPLVAGWDSEGPYDAIIIDGAISHLPDSLAAQVKDGGRLAVVEGAGKAGQAKIYMRAGATLTGRFGFNAAVPMLPGFATETTFQF